MSNKENKSVKQQKNIAGISRRDMLMGIGAATVAYAGSYKTQFLLGIYRQNGHTVV